MFPIQHSLFKKKFVDEQGIIPHTHTITSEIIQAHTNNGKIIINNKAYNMHENGLYFIHGHSPHLVVPDDMSDYNHSIIVLNTNVVEQLCINLKLKNIYNEVFKHDGGCFCTLSDSDALKVSGLFLKANQILMDDDAMKFYMLTTIFCDLLKIGFENKVAYEHDSSLATIISFIKANISTPLSIEEISIECNLSKYYMCRMFKEKMGITIGNFIRSHRLSLAKKLLLETDLSISTIARKCGFSEGTFFTKVFSAEEGCSPSFYRKKYS